MPNDFIRRHQAGDTIIEVLIAIAIVSLVLVTAYVITNKNTQATQNNQERIQAQHLVESQIEALKAKGSLDNPGGCFVGTTDTASGPTSPCNRLGQSGSGADYKVTITGPSETDTSNVYTVKATWTSIGGTGMDDSNVTMYYRLD